AVKRDRELARRHRPCVGGALDFALQHNPPAFPPPLTLCQWSAGFSLRSAYGGPSVESSAPPTRGRWRRDKLDVALVVQNPSLYRHKVGRGGQNCSRKRQFFSEWDSNFRMVRIR